MDLGARRLVKVGNYSMTGRILGKGHFARVQEASHINLNVKVAIKTINYRDIKDEYVIKNLRREAKILAKVSHPNVVYLFETITSTKCYYIITELVSGGDLCTYVTSQRTGKLDEKQARPLARQLISAVAHLHERGIVHRDLKMENILMDESRKHIKLVDFGLSNYQRGANLFNTHCGSPEYAAPELYISGQQYGPEVDIWSLGIVFYGMLVGMLPFQSWQKSDLTPEAKRKQLIRETKIGLTHRHQKSLADCSLLFRNLIGRMLCPNPKDRITMMNLQAHAWIYGRFLREYPHLDGAWKRMVMSRIAKMCDIPAGEVYRTIENKRYSPLAGIYNIARWHELQRKIKCEDIGKDIQKKFAHINVDNSSNHVANQMISTKRKIVIPPAVGSLNCQNSNIVKDLETSSHGKQNSRTIRSTEVNLKGYIINQPPKSNQQNRLFTMNIGAAINKILHKTKDQQKESTQTAMQHKIAFFEKKSTSGIPLHTAARAAIRAENEKRLSHIKKCN